MTHDELYNNLNNLDLTPDETRFFVTAVILSKLSDDQIRKIVQMNNEEPSKYVDFVRHVIAEGDKVEEETYKKLLNPLILDEIMKAGKRRKRTRRMSKKTKKSRMRKTRISKKMRKTRRTSR